MPFPARSTTGLEAILETFEMRYEYDLRGRIIGCKSGGVLPRFVLGRAAEGCVWRFSAGIGADVVSAVSKLAGRELGFPIDQTLPLPPPERLVMIERILGPVLGRDRPAGGQTPSREVVTRDGVMLAEIWALE